MMATSKTSAHVSRGRFLRWLRRVHGWIGLWGAVLGLLFGLSGFLLNHRMVMKIPALKMEQSEFQLPLPAEKPGDAQEFSRWVQHQFRLKQAAYKVHDEAAAPIPWGDRTLTQPAHWKAEFHMPQQSLTAEYWVGNQFVSIKRQDVNAWGFIMRMHKGVGMNAGWILLVDSLAGAMLVLSITGVLLWTKMRGSRLAMAGLIGTSLGMAVLFTVQSI
jgi:uncharacterized protein